MTSTALIGQPRLQPVAALRAQSAYQPPEHDEAIDLHLDRNEGPVADESLLAALSNCPPDALRRYPHTSALERSLADRFALSPQQVLVTNGGDEAIDRACRAMLGPGRSLLTLTPTFEMVARSGRLTGGAVKEVPWFDEAFPVDAFIERLDASACLVAIVTPNNPTGAIAHLDDLQAVSRAAPQALLLVDLAYIEYADDDITKAVLELPNAIAVRTFSKARGMAGLRVGYAMGPSEVIGRLRAAGSPYPVAGPSLLLAEHCLTEGDERCAMHVQKIRDERDELLALLRRFGVDAPASQGNFVFMRSNYAAAIDRALRSCGIAVRSFPSMPELNDALRITCPGDERDFARLAEALSQALRDVSAGGGAG